MEAIGLGGKTTRRDTVLGDGPASRIVRRASRTAGLLVTTALAVLSLGAAAGRWQVLPATAVGDGVAVETGDLVFVVPVPALSLRGGDTIYVQYAGSEGALRHVGRVVDSWDRRFEIGGVAGGDTEVAQLPPKVWRVSHRVPRLGLVFRLLVGSTQSIALMLGGIALIALSEARRKRAHRVPGGAYVESVAGHSVTDDTRVAALRP